MQKSGSLRRSLQTSLTWVIVRKLKGQRCGLNRVYEITWGGEKLDNDDNDDDDNYDEGNKDDEDNNNDGKNEKIVDKNNSKVIYKLKYIDRCEKYITELTRKRM